MLRHPEVYEPCDDSFALADAIATDIARFYPSLATCASDNSPSSDQALPPSLISHKSPASPSSNFSTSPHPSHSPTISPGVPSFPALVVELGSGSGFVLTSVALALRALSAPSAPPVIAGSNSAATGAGGVDVAGAAGRDAGSGAAAPSAAVSLASQAAFLAVDINPHAADITRQTLAAHSIPADVVLSDLGTALIPRMAGQVNILIFNPPYVPTSPQEVHRPGITQAWAGGDRGREVIDRAMEVSAELLSPTGVFYLLVVAENDPEEVGERMRGLGFEGEELLRRGTEEEVIVIVVAMDAREGSRDAFFWALDNLIKPEDHVTLLNVRPTRATILPTRTDLSASSGGQGDDDDGYMLAMEQILNDVIHKAHERFPGLKVDKAIKSGDPKNLILDEVVIRDAAALVMSSRGLSPVQRTFLGSVSDYCSRNAECPVIVVRGKSAH
ncbi:unnamed protein product [Closterium sp. NIES-64]|nr:unnamed protein product [Closterium sp. NIES-64]